MDDKYLFVMGKNIASYLSGFATYDKDDLLYANPRILDQFTAKSIMTDPREPWDEIHKIGKLCNKTTGPLKAANTLSKIGRESRSLFVTQDKDGKIIKAGTYEKWQSNEHLRAIQCIDCPDNTRHQKNITMSCLNCKKKYKINTARPECTDCNDYCRPDIAMFDENVDIDSMFGITDRWIMMNNPTHVVVIGNTSLYRGDVRNLLNDYYPLHCNLLNSLSIKLIYIGLDGIDDFYKKYNFKITCRHNVERSDCWKCS